MVEWRASSSFSSATLGVHHGTSTVGAGAPISLLFCGFVHFVCVDQYSGSREAAVGRRGGGCRGESRVGVISGGSGGKSGSKSGEGVCSGSEIGSQSIEEGCSGEDSCSSNGRQTEGYAHWISVSVVADKVTVAKYSRWCEGTHVNP